MFLGNSIFLSFLLICLDRKKISLQLSWIEKKGFLARLQFSLSKRGDFEERESKEKEKIKEKWRGFDSRLARRRVPERKRGDKPNRKEFVYWFWFNQVS